MKRGLTALFLLLLPAVMLGGDGTHSYLVGTRHSAREAIGRLAREDAAVANGEPFTIVNAFRADLTEAEADALRQSPEVRYVEREVQRYAVRLPLHIGSNQLRSLTSQTTPWGVQAVNAPAVWRVTRGAKINVAILDTGIDVTHPDLQAAYSGGFNTYFGDPKYTTEPQAPIDDEGHGTHVSGTVAASDNDFGVVGVAPGAHIWAVRVLRNGSGTDAKIAAGIEWVIKQKQALGGNWIISMSLAGCTSTSTEADAISSAVNAGILVVAAASNHIASQPDTGCIGGLNENYYSVGFPAAYPGVIAVAAVDSTSTVADFSNFGPQVSIAAPGVDVLSTFPIGKGSISYVSTSNGKAFAAVPLIGSAIGTLTGTFIDCGLGKALSDFPLSVNGNIALIERGDVTFATKVKNAQTAGARAVVIYNKDGSDVGGFTLTADPADANHAWPVAVALTLNDGQTLLNQTSARLTVANASDDYANLNGTSMATPHVTAVAALVWSTAPSATADAVKQALLSTAHDLGTPGVDNYYGYGLVDAAAAVKLLSGIDVNAGKPLAPPYTGRPPGRRGH